MASPTCDRLWEIAEQCIQSEFTAFDAEERTPVRELSTEFVNNSITAVTQALDQYIDNYLEYEQICKAEQDVLEMISFDRELPHERKLKKKITIDAYVVKKPRFAEDLQSVPHLAYN
jgi:hypothetical protein